jgi:hypothetical protein
MELVLVRSGRNGWKYVYSLASATVGAGLVGIIGPTAPDHLFTTLSAPDQSENLTQLAEQ